MSWFLKQLYPLAIFRFGCYTHAAFFFGMFFRLQHEAELKLLEDEAAKRLVETIRKNVEERVRSEEVSLEIGRRIERGRRNCSRMFQLELKKKR